LHRPSFGQQMVEALVATSTNPAKESLRNEQREQHRIERKEGRDAWLTHALENTFPASDPIASQTATKIGAALRADRRTR
jgi:hypothetical protein